MTHEQRMEIFKKIDIGCVTDALIYYGVGAWCKNLFPVEKSARVYGQAVTARFDIVTLPEAEVTPMEVIERAHKGDVLVWSAPLRTNLMGGNIFAFAKKHGVSGIVLDGYHRDTNEILGLGGAVFSRGSSCGSSPTNFKATEETVNIPVSIDGVIVRPGDYICGDIDGVMIIPKERVDEVLTEALHHMGWERVVKEAIDMGYSAEQMKSVYASGSLD